MAKRKSIYERMALKQKVAMVKKSESMRTLRDELTRSTTIQNQLAALVDDTAIKPGATTGMQIRSANWYAAQVQTQLATISNRNEFLAEEVSNQEALLAIDRHRHELSVQKGIAHRLLEREEREECAAALLPARPTPQR